MAKAARAIIFEGNKLLVMYRNNHGSKYFTLVGGRINEGENLEQCLIREVKEETGLTVTHAQLMFIEEHQKPSNEQHIYLCSVAPYESVAIQETSEESYMNRIGINTHEVRWVDVHALGKLPFRTPQLQKALENAIKKGFPNTPVKI
ncbi:MAG: NUDIX hydrolase [bacterium]|nr:NUDIX hydrolase [bacterium]